MMRKTALFLAFIFISAPAFAGYVEQFRGQNSWATKTDDMPPRNQTRYDYTGTTSGYPIYTGHAAPSVASSSATWRICKATDASTGPTLIQCADDLSWDDRASGTYT